MVRVLDRGRVGSFRTGIGDPGELENAIRCAMAQSRVREPLAGLPHLPASEAPLTGPTDLHDPAIAALSRRKARSYLMDLPLKQENVRLRWAEARVAVFSSRNVRRQIATTSAGLEVRTGRRPGAGRAEDAGRKLEQLDPPALLDLARSRHATGSVTAHRSGALPAVLSPLAVIDLLNLLSETSFSAKAYYDGTSFLREHINIQVFDRRFNLRDDATDPAGIPFPFDLEGTAKRPVDLILKGAPKTPTLDQRQAAVLGLPPTAHAIGGNNARAENLILQPGESAGEELLTHADDGVWIGWLDAIESLDPRRVHFRARAQGVRRITNGRLAAALPDLIWEDSLLRAFSALSGIGKSPARRLSADGYLGGTCAPALALGSIETRPSS
jgi:predicted Zn-dependent protease